MKDAKELKLMTLEDVLSQIENGMTIGIGTGSTIELLIPQIAELIQQKNYTITGVCTSNKTAFLAKELAMNIVDVNDVEKIDLAIDGADEVDSALNLIKGGGGALFREKVIDETFALPVEVDKFNWYQVAKKIERTYDIHVSRRVNEDVPFITDNGNYILDCSLQNRIPAYELHEFLIHLTGVLETGYFLDIADQVIVGTQEGVKILNKET